MGKIPFIKMQGKGCFYYLIVFPIILILNLYIGIFALLWFAIKWLWQKATATPESRKISAIVVGGASVFLCGFMAITAFLQSIGVLPTATLTPTIDVIALQNTVQAEVELGFTQTALAIPTDTVTPVAVETSTPQPSPTPAPSATSLPTFTSVPTIVFVQPTSGPGPASGSYDSNGDGKVTCADFQTQAAAQKAYNAGYTNLDGNDKDGKACEALP